MLFVRCCARALPDHLSVHLTMSREITAEELAKHNKENDLWVAIHGNVYDASKFAEEHPGGVDVLMEQAGTSLSIRPLNHRALNSE